MPTEESPTSASAGRWSLGTQDTDYIYLTDEGRSDLQVSIERIEFKKRMINGRMRAYHVADKKNFSVSWRDLPSSRSELTETRFSGSVSGWASSQQMLDWYKSHTDSFWMTLVYDTTETYGRLNNQNIPLKFSLEFYNVFFEEFSYNVKKRGPTHDLWDVSMSLVEV